MLCDAAIVVSIMMNGVCCLWQEHNEQNRRNAIRTDIRAEYWHHKIMEQELYKAEQREMMMNARHYGGLYDVYSPDFESDEHIRRLNYMTDKMNASNQSITSRTSQRTSCTAPPRVDASPQPKDSNTIMTSRSWPNNSYRTYPKRQEYREAIEHALYTSLLDTDDSENEEESMVSIPLHV